ncbi:helix-turn-helix transcriptional regulator [Actinosynnema sp. NPDC020468]|uniref:helix-turn-helix domain-containing protein n=1 Tax=Actinosynnema sp. NPDC020468 TaxID=3154488 RepID=UPI0033F00515
MSETARALRSARESAKVSLAALAKRTHYSKSLLGMVETGQRTATPELIAAYERALDAQGLGEDVNRRELLAAAAAVLAGTTTPDPLVRLLGGLSAPGAHVRDWGCVPPVQDRARAGCHPVAPDVPGAAVLRRWGSQ